MVNPARAFVLKQFVISQMELTLEHYIRRSFAKPRKAKAVRRRVRGLLAPLSVGFALMAALLLLMPGSEEDGSILRGTISRVVDGDTVDLLDNGMQRHRIRLFGIDAPESRQAFGRQATVFLADMLEGQRVEVVRKDKDRYGRTIGQIMLHGRDINRLMVQKGYAWAYRHYSEAYVKDENRARRLRIGLWRDKNPVEPYLFRKKRKKSPSPKGAPRRAVLFRKTNTDKLL